MLAHHPKEILDLDAFFSLRTEVVKDMEPELQEGGVDRPPGMDAPPGEEEALGAKVGILKHLRLLLRLQLPK